MTRREMREQAFVLLFEKMFNADSTLQELAEFADESKVPNKILYTNQIKCLPVLTVELRK